MRKRDRGKMPSGEAQVQEKEAVMLMALFGQRERLLSETDRQVRMIQETINDLAGNVAQRAGWPKSAPAGGRYEFGPGLDGNSMVMLFRPARQAHAKPAEAEAETGTGQQDSEPAGEGDDDSVDGS